VKNVTFFYKKEPVLINVRLVFLLILIKFAKNVINHVLNVMDLAKIIALNALIVYFYNKMECVNLVRKINSIQNCLISVFFAIKNAASVLVLQNMNVINVRIFLILI
jgi:hypothetical protein